MIFYDKKSNTIVVENEIVTLDRICQEVYYEASIEALLTQTPFGSPIVKIGRCEVKCPRSAIHGNKEPKLC